MLSGDPNDLLLTESFHGSIISWARQAGMFNLRDTLSNVDLNNKTEIESTWRTWIKAEEAARVVLALHLQDSQFAALFHHEPLLRHDPQKLPNCCSEKVFAASSATQWYDLVVASRPPLAEGTAQRGSRPRSVAPYSSSPINAYTSLAGIHASVYEARPTTLTEEAMSRVWQSLTLWREVWFPKGFEPEGVSGWATIQWHQICMSLYVDFDLLERAVGRNGHSEEDENTVSNWAKSVGGKHCAAHAVLILRRLEPMPLSSEPGIHIPLAAFHAGLVLYSHLRWSGTGTATIPFEAPELNASNFKKLARVLGTNNRSPNVELDISMLCRLTDLLQRQGHWGISRKFATVLEVLVDDISDAGSSSS